jgi:Zn-finger nucleic acid-binding protein
MTNHICPTCAVRLKKQNLCSAELFQCPKCNTSYRIFTDEQLESVDDPEAYDRRKMVEDVIRLTMFTEM